MPSAERCVLVSKLPIAPAIGLCSLPVVRAANGASLQGLGVDVFATTSSATQATGLSDDGLTVVGSPFDGG